ncbi:MAG: hypothetical protein QXR45_15345 [Candidatus Bathyarchaeia archaeon]
MSLDEEAENILKRLIEKGSVDFYELVDKYADEKKISVEEAYDTIATIIFKLAGYFLVSLSGLEENSDKMVVSATELGEKYVKNRSIVEDIKSGTR